MSFLCQNPGILEVSHKEDMLVLYGPLIRECDPTCPHSGLSQGTYLTNKHNHFKEIRDCGNNNCYTIRKSLSKVRILP